MNKCHRCKGEKFVTEKANDLSGKSNNTPSVVICPMCDGKGYISASDREKYYDVAKW